MLDELRLGAWLAQARARLNDRSDQPGLEASLLAAYLLGKPRAWILAHPEQALTAGQTAKLNSLLGRLAEGTPLPYLTGTQEFYGLSFSVNPGVLIPRPETELLVEQALAWLSTRPQRRLAADVGSGSGCIAVTLARHVPDLRVLASDISPLALHTVRKNAAAHAVSPRLHLIQSDLLSPVSARIDLVCANLPYIPSATLRNLEVARYEPHLALDGGADGLDAIRRLLNDAPRWIAPGGLLLLEIEARQGQAAAELARQAISGSRVEVLADLAGIDRLVRIDLNVLPTSDPVE